MLFFLHTPTRKFPIYIYIGIVLLLNGLENQVIYNYMVLITYKIFSFIIQSTSCVLSRIFHYYIYDLQVELQT